MSLNVPEIIRQGLEEALTRVLQEVIQEEATKILQDAFGNDGTLRQRIKDELRKGFEELIQDIEWEIREPGFRP